MIFLECERLYIGQQSTIASSVYKDISADLMFLFPVLVLVNRS